MPLYVNESEVASLVSMKDAIVAVENAFRKAGTAEAQIATRQRPRLRDSMLHLMGGAIEGVGLGLKAYTVTPSGVRYLVLLWDQGSGELLAILEADHLGTLRTGAASGVATRYMAAENASTLAVIGTGHQAHTQVDAICEVRPIQDIRVYSRTAASRARFAETAEERLGISVTAVESARDALRGADIVATITNARTPVIDAAAVAPHCHVNAAGSNRANAAELGPEIFARARLVATDDVNQARIECGDIIAAVEAGTMKWERVLALADIVARPESVTGGGGISIFESQGIGIEDVALARVVYEHAVARGAGTHFPA